MKFLGGENWTLGGDILYETLHMLNLGYACSCLLGNRKLKVEMVGFHEVISTFLWLPMPRDWLLLGI